MTASTTTATDYKHTRSKSSKAGTDSHMRWHGGGRDSQQTKTSDGTSAMK